MRPRPLTFAAIISAILCAATITLWILTATSTRRIILFHRNPAVYAWGEGLGVRIIGSQGVRSWDIGYFPVTLLTLLVPAVWARRRLVSGANHREAASHEVQDLRKQIRFLLPGAIAVYLIIGMTALAIDTRHPSVWLYAAVMDIALVVNLISRYRLKARLQRLLSGCCPSCGYDLTANVSGVCPECGRTSRASA